MAEAATLSPTAMGEKVTELTNSVIASANTPSRMLMLWLIVAVALVFLFAVTLYYVIMNFFSDRKKFRARVGNYPTVGTQLSTLPGGDIPPPVNGKRMSFTFWIFLYDIERYAGTPRHVFHRGSESESFETASPYVYLDPNTNKLHVMLGSIETNAYNGATNIPTTDDQKRAFIVARRGITIDYIPLQRWVHVAVVINEEVNGGQILAYLDGELVNMKDHNFASADLVTMNIQTANLNKGGDIYIGGSPNDNIGPGFSGMLSRLTFYNHDINIKDVRDSYLEGPVNDLTSRFGLQPYGVQTPIYRVS